LANVVQEQQPRKGALISKKFVPPKKLVQPRQPAKKTVQQQQQQQKPVQPQKKTLITTQTKRPLTSSSNNFKTVKRLVTKKIGGGLADGGVCQPFRPVGKLAPSKSGAQGEIGQGTYRIFA